MVWLYGTLRQCVLCECVMRHVMSGGLLARGPLDRPNQYGVATGRRPSVKEFRALAHSPTPCLGTIIVARASSWHVRLYHWHHETMFQSCVVHAFVLFSLARLAYAAAAPMQAMQSMLSEWPGRALPRCWQLTCGCHMLRHACHSRRFERLRLRDGRAHTCTACAHCALGAQPA